MHLLHEVNAFLHFVMTHQIRFIIFAFCIFSSNALYAQEVISLLYNERAPYQITHKDGSVSGLTATPVQHAFNQANIQILWKLIPANRQLMMIKENKEKVCGVGWFINDNRKIFAKFSKPIYRDKPTVVIANLQFSSFVHDHLIDIFKNKNITVLIKEKYSYGAFIDDLLVKYGVNTATTTAENIGMVKMIKEGRADVMLSSEEEADYFFNDANVESKNFILMKFKESPKGEYRHLMCSKNISDELMKKINMRIPDIP